MTDYTRLTPETVEKLRQFESWFGSVKEPQIPHFPDDMNEKAFKLYQEADEVFSQLYFLHYTGKEQTILVHTLLEYIDSAIPFDPTNYTEGIQGVMWMISMREEYERLEGELKRLNVEIDTLADEGIVRQGEAKPHLPKSSKLKPSLPTATVLVFFVSMLVSAALTFYLLKPT